MKRNFAFLFAVCAAAVTIAPAHAATITLVPSNAVAFPGDTGGTFEVDLTNDGEAGISVLSFSFELSVTDPDLSLTGASFATSSRYIFTNDSFDQESDPPAPLNYDSGATLDASDITADFTGITIAAGQTVGLGLIGFDVAPGAAPGTFAVSFTGGTGADGANDIVDSSFATIDSTFNDGTVSINAVTSAPEPATFWLLGSILAMIAGSEAARRLRINR